MSMIPMKSKPLFESESSYLLASDFDQTLSFNDSGWDVSFWFAILSPLLGVLLGLLAAAIFCR
jgi:hypothetical protein